MQLVGVVRDKVPKEESDTEPCHDLGAIQVECTDRGHNCIKQLEMSHRTLISCRTECQRYQDSDSPCVFFVFRYGVLI